MQLYKTFQKLVLLHIAHFKTLCASVSLIFHVQDVYNKTDNFIKRFCHLLVPQCFCHSQKVASKAPVASTETTHAFIMLNCSCDFGIPMHCIKSTGTIEVKNYWTSGM